MEKPDPDFPFTAAFDLLNPPLGRIRPRQPPPETSDVEIDLFPKRALTLSRGVALNR